MIRLREFTQRRGRKGFALGAISLVALVVLLAHSGPDAHPMPDHDAMGTAAAVCLAVLEGGGVLLLGLGLLSLIRRARPPFTPYRLPRAPIQIMRRLGPAPPRAGPAELQVFLS